MICLPSLFCSLESGHTRKLPWLQHGGDPYSVINIFTRRQTGNVTKGFSQTEEWKHDDDDDDDTSSVTESARQEDLKENEHSLSDEIGSEIGSTHSLIQDITVSKVIAREPETVTEKDTQGEKQERHGQISTTPTNDELDVASLLVDQSHLGTDLYIGGTPQLYPSDPVAASGLTAEAEADTAGGYRIPDMVRLRISVVCAYLCV